MILPRLYPILDTPLLRARALDLLSAAEAMRDAGVTFIQLRHKGEWSRNDFAAAEQVAALGMHLIVNDRADIAKLLNAGLHLGQTDIPPAEARRFVGGATTIGFSTHNREQLAAAADQPVDYLALGPIFSTSSKQNPDPVVGLDGLRELRSLTPKPLVAIGGITRSTARAALDAGADSVAVIGDLYPDPLTPATLRNRMKEWRRLLEK